MDIRFCQIANVYVLNDGFCDSCQRGAMCDRNNEKFNMAEFKKAPQEIYTISNTGLNYLGVMGFDEDGALYFDDDENQTINNVEGGIA